MCESTENGTVLTCIVPPLTSSTVRANVSYTVRFGNAPGPDLASSDLTLDVAPNPSFARDGSALEDSEFSAGEGGLLTITVS